MSYRRPHPLDPDDLAGLCREFAIGILIALPVLLALACICYWIDPGVWPRVLEGFK